MKKQLAKPFAVLGIAVGVLFAQTISIGAANAAPVAISSSMSASKLASDVSVSSISVNGKSVKVGSSVLLAVGAKSATVVATPTSKFSKVSVEGATGLKAGVNVVKLNVTALNGDSITHIVRLLVPVYAKISVRFESGSSAVTSEAESALATLVDNVRGIKKSVVVTGFTTQAAAESRAPKLSTARANKVASKLKSLGLSGTYSAVGKGRGSNAQAIIAVTYVPVASNNVNLSTFTLGGDTVVDGQTVQASFGTEALAVVAVTEDSKATVEVEGGDALEVGENSVTATVTAQDGTVKVYTVKIVVAGSSNTDLSTFTIDGSAVSNGSTVEVVAGTTSVEVVAEASDENATVDVVGGDELVPGENTVTVTVTAQNGTELVSEVTVNVALSEDTSLASFTINGTDVADGDSIPVPAGTTSVEVLAEASMTGATVDISGDTDLVAGDNIVTVTVNATDGENSDSYNVIVNVLLSSDSSLKSLTVNGKNAVVGSVVFVDPGTLSVEVLGDGTIAGTTVEVLDESNTDLVAGFNTVNITVTTTNDTVVVYTIQVYVGLKIFQVAGVNVNDGDTVSVPTGTGSVRVVAVANESTSTVDISGNTDLVPGENIITVDVTTADGDTESYNVIVAVALSSNTALATFEVNGSATTDGSTINVAAGTTSVLVNAVSQDAFADVTVAGDTALVSGSNTLTVTVDATDGTQKIYTITVVVAGDVVS